MSQSEDMTAIDEFMKRMAPVTPEATALRQSWMVWYPALSWYERSFDTNIRDEASTRRNKFNLANAKTQAEKDLAVRVITTGMDTNQMQGLPRKPTLPTGEVGTQIKKPTTATALTGTHPVIKQGSTGPAVVEWQKFLGTAADGKFGPNTTSLTVAFQKKKGLAADGVVGNATWTAALGAPPVEAVKVEEPGLLASLFGPTPAPTPQPVTAATIQRPVVAKPGGAATGAIPKPAATASTKPSASSGGSSAASTSIMPVAQAGMLGSLGALGKLPLWAKIAGAAAIVGGIIFGRNAKMVNYSTGKEVKRRRAA
jgi:hypothetical protein